MQVILAKGPLLPPLPMWLPCRSASGTGKNKRKLIIPLGATPCAASRHAGGSGGGISEQVMNLAVAMQQARKEVEAEQAAREKARQEEEERRQAEREAEATPARPENC
ncbi:hypothetical protein TcBrA4_0026800 [Trypanosoma cruzi]|nr:hypothetical protein TcBrA4_0026800 [Trypanosoma cruzi]